MLSNIRKYTGLMFVVLILLFVGLVFLETGGRPSGYGSGPVMIEIDGRAYPQQEFDRLSTNPLRLISDLSNQSFPARFALAPYLYQLASPPDSRSNEPDPRYFLVNRQNVQEAGRQIGFHPSVDQVEEFIRERVFVNQDQTFNADAYSRYVDKSLPRLGMSVKDMNDILREVLILERLQDVVGSGLKASKAAVTDSIADREQQISYQLVTFPASTFEAEISPSEEEVKTYWEENRGRYLIEEKRRVSYVIADPDFDALLKKKKAEAAAEKPEEAADTGEEPVPAEGDADPAPGEKEEEITLTNEERDAAAREAALAIDNFWVALQDDEGEGFEEKAAEAGIEVKSTELFTKETSPADFRVATETINRKRVVDEIFEASTGSNPMDAISNVYPISGKRYLVFRLEEVVEPVEMTYEQAKEEARLDLVQERARIRMAEAAEEARKAILAAMADGKSFAEAAEAQGLEPVVREDVTQETRPPGEPTPGELFTLASKVNPGELSEVLTQNDESRSVFRSLFVFVDERELVNTALADTTVEQEMSRMNNAYRQIALQNWLSQRYSETEVTIP